jgi:NADH pyrophosphatase NudC (nudix superfamily)
MAEYYRKKQPSCTTPDGREWFASGGGNTNPEYIEREAVHEILERYQTAPHIKQKTHFSKGMLTAIRSCIELVDIVPAADVVPVVHGRWITDEKGVTYCGRCRIIDDYASVHNYCPNCGARMDGDTDG